MSKFGTIPTRTAEIARLARVLLCPAYLSNEKKHRASPAQHLLSPVRHLLTSPQPGLNSAQRINNPLTTQVTTASAGHNCRRAADISQPGAFSRPQQRGQGSIDAIAQRPLAAPAAGLQMAAGVSTPENASDACRRTKGAMGDSDGHALGGCHRIARPENGFFEMAERCPERSPGVSSSAVVCRCGSGGAVQRWMSVYGVPL
jgi:hypothetical protein